MKKSEVKDIWAVTFLEVVATDRVVSTTTHIKAETLEKALSFFNEEIADGNWVRKAKIKDMKQLEVYEAE